MPAPSRDSVFISYSHYDTTWLEWMLTFLKPFTREGTLSVWNDTYIKVGDLWKREIDVGLQRAAIGLLLVSPHFLASDFIRDRELPLLVQEADVDGCRILPLVVGPCLYRETPELARYQSVNPPDQPLSAMSQAAAEQEMVNLARSVVELTRGDGQ